MLPFRDLFQLMKRTNIVLSFVGEIFCPVVVMSAATGNKLEKEKAKKNNNLTFTTSKLVVTITRDAYQTET